jgi:hypothetical protein
MDRAFTRLGRNKRDYGGKRWLAAAGLRQLQRHHVSLGNGEGSFDEPPPAADEEHWTRESQAVTKRR